MLYFPHEYGEDNHLNIFDVVKLSKIFERWARMKGDESISKEVWWLKKQLNDAYCEMWLNK